MITKIDAKKYLQVDHSRFSGILLIVAGRSTDGTSLLKAPIVPPTVFRCHFILDHLASFCRGYLDSCMQWIGWLFAVDALVVARCVCSINTQAPINLARDDHWPERRAGLFYWLVRASLQHCTITYDRLLLPKISIKGSKGSPGSGHSKISSFSSSGADVFTRFISKDNLCDKFVTCTAQCVHWAVQIPPGCLHLDTS